MFDYKLENEKAELYADLLGDIETAALHNAAVQHMQRGKTFPLPVELRELAMSDTILSSKLEGF